MRMLVSTVCSAAMAIGAVLSTGSVSVAAPLPHHVESGSATEAIQIQSHRGFYRNGNYSYYNGHRGYRYQRPGWHSYNGWWFPPAAFVVVRPAPVYRAPGNAHVQWCYDRYRSYRAQDNTYQPSYGPRRQCVSPYR
jgi:BA14K-like protein